jgi:hypothetical protein
MQKNQPNQIRLNQLLLKMIKSKDYFPFYYMKMDYIIKKLKLSFDDIYENNQIGGSKHTFETKFKSNTYFIDYHTSKTDPINKLIFIYRQKVSDQTYDETLESEYTDLKHCALLSYSNNQILNIILITINSDCIRSNNQKYIEHCGSILLKIIIRLAKIEGFKKIILEDGTNFYCKDEHNMRFDLSKGRTLTDGITFYAKYGFKYMDEDNNTIYMKNKSIMDNLKTSDINIEQFIRLIFKKLMPIYKIYTNKDFIIDINFILDSHLELTDKPLYEFLKMISYNCCIIFSLILDNLFNMFGLTYIQSPKMYLDL